MVEFLASSDSYQPALTRLPDDRPLRPVSPLTNRDDHLYRQEKLVSLVNNCGDFDTGPDITNARSRVYSQIGLD